MARQWLGSVALLFAGTGLAWGQAAGPASVATPQPVQWVQTADAAQPPKTDNPDKTNTVIPVVFSSPLAPPAPPPEQNPSRGCFSLCQPDKDHSQVWFQAEYLLWWIRPGSLPPVVGSAPTAQVATGTLPSDSITSLFGSNSNELDYHQQSGVRLSFGLWLDRAQEWGIDGSFFQLEQKSIGNSFSSGGDPVLGPVFFDPNTNTNNLILASLPNFTSGPLANLARTGVVTVDANNRLWSGEANIRKQLGAVFFADHLDLLVGFRHLQFSEGVDVVTDSESAPGSASPSTMHVADHLGALNQFYGAQVGLASHTQVGRWSFDAIGKLALGDMHEVSNINGSTLLSSATGTIASNTGILAEPTNIGRPTRERFDVLPELTFNVGYQVIDNVRVTAGYNFLYLSSVMRAGNLVDGVDARQVRSLSTFDPTAQATRPEFQASESRFWAQGLNIGLEVRY